MTRRSPNEDAVRETMREEDAEVRDSDAGQASEPAEAPEEAAAAEETSAAEETPSADSVEAERDRYLELAQRTQADFENYRKRAAKDAANAGERAKLGLLRDFLPVVDNLERALESAGDGDASLAEGVRLVHAELVNVLQRNGVQPIDADGQVFDPTVHEAISTAPAQDGVEPGTVVNVVEKGYRLGDSVIRPARVIVSA